MFARLAAAFDVYILLLISLAYSPRVAWRVGGSGIKH